MAVGAFAAYNFELRVAWLPLLASLLLGGLVAALVAVVFGLPSLRIKASICWCRHWRRSSSCHGR